MNTRRIRAGLLLAVPMLLVALLVESCSDSRSPIVPTPADTTAPNAVTNLAAGSPTAVSIELTWTATGDDGATGTATQYDIRYSTSAITAANFAAATQVTGEPTPTAAGSSQGVTVTGLTPGTLYYFAGKVADEVPNWSSLSNLPQASTNTEEPADMTPPVAIADLATRAVTVTSIQLTWTAPGDDGTIGAAAQYDIRYSTSEITAANFGAATAVTGEPAPTASGTSQGLTVSGLSQGTTYHFAMKTADEVPNWSTISNVPAATTTASGDVAAPAAIEDLAAGAVTATSVVLSWTAPGDDGRTGTAHEYDLRYSTSEITAANFDAATEVPGEPTPALAGSAQEWTLHDLLSSTTYYFALKTSDEVGNWSALSNVPTGTTTQGPDDIGPARVLTLGVVDPTTTSLTVTWQAVGDDGEVGTASHYDLRYSTAAITDQNWPSAMMVVGVPAPRPAGQVELYTVTGLAAGTTYYFALSVADEVPNWSALSNVAAGTTTVAAVDTPSGPFTAPGLSELVLPDTVCISSDDQYAQVAKLLATMQLGIARGYAGWGQVFFAPLESADGTGSYMLYDESGAAVEGHTW